jgi:hypothetical protein
MKAIENTVFIDNYYSLLNSLGREDKIKIMAKLSLSIAESHTKKENVTNRFFGAFLSDKSAEEIIADIRGTRSFNRIIEPL